MRRWVTIYSLLKDGFSWEVLQSMGDNEILMLEIISEEISKVRQDYALAQR